MCQNWALWLVRQYLLCCKIITCAAVLKLRINCEKSLLKMETTVFDAISRQTSFYRLHVKISLPPLVSSNCRMCVPHQKRKTSEYYRENETWARVSSVSVNVSGKHRKFVPFVEMFWLQFSFRELPERLKTKRLSESRDICATAAGILRYRHIRYLATSVMTFFIHHQHRR